LALSLISDRPILPILPRLTGGGKGYDKGLTVATATELRRQDAKRGTGNREPGTGKANGGNRNRDSTSDAWSLG